MRSLFRNLVLLALAFFFAAGIISGGLLLMVKEQTRPYHAAEAGRLPKRSVGIVFGAAVRSDGRLSPILEDRVLAAIELYNHGVIKKILMTGDNGREDYDEVSNMRRYAIEKGVPSEDITLDHAGFSTYESCYRAREIFGVQEAILITQEYHQPRALYACRALGIDVYGWDLLDWETYPNLKQRYLVREALATLKVLWNVHVTKPEPTYLGEYEGIN